MVFFVDRSPDLQASDVKYFGLDGQNNINHALLSAVDYIQTSVQDVSILKTFALNLCIDL